MAILTIVIRDGKTVLHVADGSYACEVNVESCLETLQAAIKIHMEGYMVHAIPETKKPLEKIEIYFGWSDEQIDDALQAHLPYHPLNIDYNGNQRDRNRKIAWFPAECKIRAIKWVRNSLGINTNGEKKMSLKEAKNYVESFESLGQFYIPLTFRC